MRSWSLLSGSPGVGEEGVSRGLSSGGLVRRARGWAVVSSVAFVWAAGGLGAFVLSGVLPAELVAAAGVLPAVGVAGALFLLSRLGERRGLLHAAGAVGTVALVLAVAGHLMHARGAPLRAFVPPSFGGGGAGWPGVVALLVGLLAVPLLAGARVRAMTLAFDASGADAASLRALWRALAQRGLDDAPRPARAAWGALARVMEAWRWPGLLGLDLAASLWLRVADRLRSRARDRVHADVELDALAEGLAAEGCRVDRAGRGLRVVPAGREGAVLVAPRRLAFPAVEADRAWDLVGAPEEIARLRRLLEGALGARCVFSWSRTGRRVEARLNALARDAARAATTEERGLLLEEVDRMGRALAHRALSGEERVVLEAWKLQRLRGDLLARMLAEPPGARVEGRVVAPAPAVLPPLARVMEAGGLAAMRRAVFVPHWILPVGTPWGEREVVVNALTGRADAAESRLLLDAMRRRGPGMMLEAGRPGAFLPAPVATAGLLRELRAWGEARPDALAAAETVYVPFVPGAEGYVNALTGNAAPDLGAALALAP